VVWPSSERALSRAPELGGGEMWDFGEGLREGERVEKEKESRKGPRRF